MAQAFHRTTTDRPHSTDSASHSLDGAEDVDHLAQSASGQPVREISSAIRLPWYKRPSAYWCVPGVSFDCYANAMYCDEPWTAHGHPHDYVLSNTQAGYRSKRLQPTPTLLGRSFASWLELLSPPTRHDLCDIDPVVQQGVTSVLSVLTITVGLLVVSTAGWWGSRSDMWGRRVVCCVNQLAGMVSVAGLILVATFGHLLPGRQYWWLLPTEIVSAMLGGANNVASSQAYLSDSTESSSRASYFAVLTGVNMAAVAFGPILGALVIHHTKNLLSVYYISVGIKAFALLLLIFVIPESLTASQRAENTQRYGEEKKQRSELASVTPESSSFRRHLACITPTTFLELLSPLKVLLPRRRQDGGKREYGLTLIAVAALFWSMCVGALPFIMQLGKLLFQWDAEDLGYWLSLLGFSRGVYLLVIFPLVLRVLKPQPPPIQLQGPEEPIHSIVADAAPRDDSQPQESAEAFPLKQREVSQFDLRVAQVSLCCDIIAYTAALLSVTEGQWIAASMMLAVGSGVVPTIMSLALVLAPDGDAESGRIMGAFTVVQTLGSDVLGSAVFGMTYAMTVGVFPKAILIVSTSIVVCALLCALFVRIPRAPSLGG
ncbi:major facilitator superfamily domain-containing protein [Auriculariales sp. MPI-PUGE-AT-0066]|nr:major facilitator superfamily domain-containing protein [Auriculariales sp. MPI-PUGE-AT-0066]